MDMRALDLEIGFPSQKPLPGRDRIRPAEMPCGRVGICHCRGPYREMAAAYEALSRLVKEQGLQPAGISYEMYLNDPNETPPQELQAQILFPLKELT